MIPTNTNNVVITILEMDFETLFFSVIVTVFSLSLKHTVYSSNLYSQRVVCRVCSYSSKLFWLVEIYIHIYIVTPILREAIFDILLVAVCLWL